VWPQASEGQLLEYLRDCHEICDWPVVSEVVSHCLPHKQLWASNLSKVAKQWLEVTNALPLELRAVAKELAWSFKRDRKDWADCANVAQRSALESVPGRL